MTRWRGIAKPALTGAIVVALGLYPTRTDGYCLLAASAHLSLVGPIPVYLNVNSQRHIAYVGLTEIGCVSPYCVDTQGIITEWTKVAIDEVNMASHGGPKLYFAGTVSVTTGGTSPVGIMLESFGFCADQNEKQPADPDEANFAATTSSTSRARIWFARGGNAACNGPTDHEALKYNYWWVDPNDDDGVKAINHDFSGVLVHELGHALGLAHTDEASVNEDYCAGDLLFSPAEAAVMHYGDKDFRRRLRRDDVDGLRALYGEPGRALMAAKNSTTGANAGSWGAQAAVGSLVINTPPTASDAVRTNETYLQVASTNAADELFYLLGSSTSISSTPNYVTSGTGTAGVRVRSLDPVAMMRGRRNSDDQLRLAAAWLGSPTSPSLPEGDDPDEPDNRVWWKVWNASGGWLTPKYTGLTKYKELGLSYDPASDLFLLVYIDTCTGPDTCPTPDPDLEQPADSYVYVKTISATTGLGVCTQALITAEHVLHVGSPACDARPLLSTRCNIPVVTSDPTKPALRVLEGKIYEHPEYGVDCWIRDAEPDPPPLTTDEASYGPLWMAMDGATTSGVALFSHVPALSTLGPSNTDYSELFVMTRTGGLLTGTISEQIRMRSDYWPIGVGSISRTTAPTTVWWAVTGY